MKVSSFFNVITDAKDVLRHFDNITTREQLVSRLERMKRQIINAGAIGDDTSDDFLTDILGLEMSVAQALDDTLEMATVLDQNDDETESDIDTELDSLAEMVESQTLESQTLESQTRGSQTRGSQTLGSQTLGGATESQAVTDVEQNPTSSDPDESLKKDVLAQS